MERLAGKLTDDFEIELLMCFYVTVSLAKKGDWTDQVDCGWG